MISVPKENAAISCERCSGLAWSGNAENRPYMRLSQSAGIRGIGPVARRCSTTDFDRKAAGFSPDRVDALVWAMSDLLVEPMPSEGHFEYMRQLAASLKPAPPEPPKPVYAIGSMEWAAQQ